VVYQEKEKVDSMDSRWVTGLFFDPIKSDFAVSALERRGIPRSSISVLMTDATRTRHLQGATEDATMDASKAAEGAGVGGAVGGVVGATIAAIAAIGSVITFPGLGLVVAGPLLAALAGGGAGAATGGFMGSLIGLGLSEDRATYYQTGLLEGGILVGVSARDNAEVNQFTALMREFGADEIRSS
jgi:hypothetical protein